MRWSEVKTWVPDYLYSSDIRLFVSYKLKEKSWMMEGWGQKLKRSGTWKVCVQVCVSGIEHVNILEFILTTPLNLKYSSHNYISLSKCIHPS